MLSSVINLIYIKIKFNCGTQANIFYINDACVFWTIVLLWFAAKQQFPNNLVRSYQLIIIDIAHCAIRSNLQFSIFLVLFIRIPNRNDNANKRNNCTNERAYISTEKTNPVRVFYIAWKLVPNYQPINSKG